MTSQNKLTVTIDMDGARTADAFAALLEAIAREMREDWTPGEDVRVFPWFHGNAVLNGGIAYWGIS